MLLSIQYVHVVCTELDRRHAARCLCKRQEVGNVGRLQHGGHLNLLLTVFQELWTSLPNRNLSEALFANE